MFSSFEHFTPAHQDAFNRDGFVVVPNVLTAAEASNIRALVLSLAATELAGNAGHAYSASGRHQRVWNLLNKGQVFSDLIQKPLVLEAMEWAFDRQTSHQKYFLSSLQANILMSGAEPQQWHLDTPIPEPHPPWIIKANTLWLLDDFTETNGATEVVPGSHLIPRRPRPDDAIITDKGIKVIAKAGSVIFTHGALWHRSGHNQTENSRVALLGSFAASFAREIANEENILSVVDPSILAQASDDLKRILGVGHGIKPGGDFRHKPMEIDIPHYKSPQPPFTKGGRG